MGKIETFTHFIPQLMRDRTIRVYLPEDYDWSGRRYPVIYMQDGQNLFSDEEAAFGMSWGIKPFMEGLERKGERGAIVVGIDNAGGGHRFDEYCPWPCHNVYPEISRGELPYCYIGGLGAGYAEYVAEVLKPFIDDKYRTMTDRSDTAVIGSSMGGLISLYIGIRYPGFLAE